MLYAVVVAGVVQLIVSERFDGIEDTHEPDFGPWSRLFFDEVVDLTLSEFGQQGQFRCCRLHTAPVVWDLRMLRYTDKASL